MLEYIKTFFPQLIDRFKNLSTSIKVLLILIILLFPFIISFLWIRKSEINRLLSSDIIINGYQLIFIFLILSLLVFVSFLFIKKSKKKLLKLFVEEWLEFKKNFDLLYDLVDVWLIRDRIEYKDDELWNKIVVQLEKYWPARDRLRKLLFEIGEKELMVYENKHWLQLKNEDNLFKERNYEGPFSLLLDLGAPIGEINHHKKAINWSLGISKEFIEHLCYKYPYLEKYSAKLKYT